MTVQLRARQRKHDKPYNPFANCVCIILRPPANDFRWSAGLRAAHQQQQQLLESDGGNEQ